MLKFKKLINKDTTPLLNDNINCYYCNTIYFNKDSYDEHLDKCLNSKIVCELCDHTFTRKEHELHWENCTHYSWQNISCFDYSVKKACIDKYNEKYKDLVKTERHFDELPKYQQDKMFKQWGCKDPNTYLDMYRNRKKINIIICEVISLL